MYDTRTFRLFVAVRELWRDRRPWVVLGIVLSVAFVVYRAIGPQQLWVARTQAFVDSNTSVVGDGFNPVYLLQPLAGLYPNILLSQAGLDAVARTSGISPNQVLAVNGGSESIAQHFSLTSRPPAPYALELETFDLAPVILIAGQASTPERAVALANGGVHGISLYLRSLGDTQQASNEAVIRQLGTPVVSPPADGPTLLMLALTFILVVSVWCGLIRLVDRAREQWRKALVSKHDQAGTFRDRASVSAPSGEPDREPQAAVRVRKRWLPAR